MNIPKPWASLRWTKNDVWMDAFYTQAEAEAVTAGKRADKFYAGACTVHVPTVIAVSLQAEEDAKEPK